jgi:hypothetical protein
MVCSVILRVLLSHSTLDSREVHGGGGRCGCRAKEVVRVRNKGCRGHLSMVGRCGVEAGVHRLGRHGSVGHLVGLDCYVQVMDD